MLYLPGYESRCPYCIVNDADDSQHMFSTCQNFNKNVKNGFPTFYDFSRSIRYNHHQRVCYRCHLPNGYEDRIHPTFKPNSPDCKYEDLLAPLAFAIYRHPVKSLHLENHFELSLPSLRHFTAWLNEPPIPGHKSNLTAVFLWYAATA